MTKKSYPRQILTSPKESPHKELIVKPIKKHGHSSNENDNNNLLDFIWELCED